MSLTDADALADLNGTPRPDNPGRRFPSPDAVYVDDQTGSKKLWLWKNYVNGNPEYWAFDNPFPIHLDNGDPQTLGEPCGYAIFKESRNARPDVDEAEVLRRIAQSNNPRSLR